LSPLPRVRSIEELDFPATSFVPRCQILWKLYFFQKRLPGLGSEPGIFQSHLFSDSITLPLSHSGSPILRNFILGSEKFQTNFYPWSLDKKNTKTRVKIYLLPYFCITCIHIFYDEGAAVDQRYLPMYVEWLEKEKKRNPRSLPSPDNLFQ
jgi:hypothetical protein